MFKILLSTNMYFEKCDADFCVFVRCQKLEKLLEATKHPYY